jgi:hypothetical protein
MFPLLPTLTRPYRQALSTAALVVLTVFPTLYVAATAIRISRTGHVRAVESELGRALGLHVTLEAVAYPRPGEVIYRGIVLSQEEPRRQGLTEVARARVVRLRRGSGELTLATEGLTIRGESPKLFLEQVGAFVQRSSELAYERISLSAPTCDLDLGPGASAGSERLGFSLREVAGNFQADRGAPTVTFSYRLAAHGSSTRCELSLVRDRRNEPPRTTLAMKTMEGLPLPARVLDVFFDTSDWLGAEARVEGALTLRQAGGKEWEAEFQGDLLDVDLAALVGRRFPGQHLSGLARVALKSARWANRPGQGLGWVEAHGELTCGQGTIGLGLLRALGSEMKFRFSPRLARLDDRKPEIDFRALGFTFAMTPDGEIRIAGALSNEFAPDVVLVSATSPLAYAPEGAANVRGLIKTLFPVEGTADPGVLVPLTSQSRILLCLPVPPDLAAKSTSRIGGN